MRRALFEAYAALAAWYIQGCDQATSWICQALFLINNLQKALVSVFNIKILRFIHAESFEEAEEQILQMQQAQEAQMASIELQLLASAQKVRDHAKTYDDWTDQHSDALESVGQALVDSCGWDPESVDQYMREVVEPIDGIEWG